MGSVPLPHAYAIPLDSMTSVSMSESSASATDTLQEGHSEQALDTENKHTIEIGAQFSFKVAEEEAKEQEEREE
jgi:hypothetical protein